MIAGDLSVCFARAEAVINGSASLKQRDVWVAALEKEANAAEAKLVAAANETRAGFEAVKKVRRRFGVWCFQMQLRQLR